jgi:hypothetical protein
VAVLIVLLAGERIGIPAQYLGVAAIYMATLVTRIADAPSGVMRLFDRFGLLTTLRAGEAAGQCLAAAILFAIGAPLGAYVLSFAGIAVATNIAILACALKVAAGAGATPAVRGLGAWGRMARVLGVLLDPEHRQHDQHSAPARAGAAYRRAARPRRRRHLPCRRAYRGGTVMAMWSFPPSALSGGGATGNEPTPRRSGMVRAADRRYLWRNRDCGPSRRTRSRPHHTTGCRWSGLWASLLAARPAHRQLLLCNGRDWPAFGRSCHGRPDERCSRRIFCPFLVLLPVLPLATLQLGIVGAAGAQIVYETLWLAIMGSEFYKWLSRDKRVGKDKGKNHVSA